MSPVAPARGSERREARSPLVRVGVVWVCACAIWLLLGLVHTEVLAGDDGAAVRLVNALVAATLGVALVVLAGRYLDRQPQATLRAGTPGECRQALGCFTLGAAAFATPSLGLLGLGVLTGSVRLSLAGSLLAVSASTALVLLTVALYEAIPEELIFRGYVFRTLAGSWGPSPAALGQAVMFAGFGTLIWVVTSGWGVFTQRLIFFLLVAVGLGCIRVASGSVWTCAGFHWAFQVCAQTLLGPDVDARGPVELVGIVPAFALGVGLISSTPAARALRANPSPDGCT